MHDLLAGKARVVGLEQLRAEAARVWARLPAGSVVWLTGELGSGKTTFVRGITEAAAAPPATSPTYALIHRYPTPTGPIIHIDCYRVRPSDDLRDLDFPGLLAEARLLVIEWPERAGALVPPPELHVRLGHTEHPDRRVLERVA